MRKVLFLDLDGVFHPFGPEKGTGLLGPRAVHRTGVFCWYDEFIELMKPFPSVELVIHSSWRDAYSLADFQDMFSALSQSVVGVTPRGKRADSIRAWLAAQPESVDFRILDDQAKEFSVDLKPNLIKCDRLRGVSAKSVQRQLLAWLNAPAT